VVHGQQRGTYCCRHTSKQHTTWPSSDARDLVNHFIIGHLVLGVGRSVRTQKNAHDVVSVSFIGALLDQSLEK